MILSRPRMRGAPETPARWSGGGAGEAGVVVCSARLLSLCALQCARRVDFTPCPTFSFHITLPVAYRTVGVQYTSVLSCNSVLLRRQVKSDLTPHKFSRQK